MGIEEVMKFVVDKLKEALLPAMENFGSEALARIDEVFPAEKKGEKIQNWLHVDLPLVITALVLVAVVFFCRCCCGGRGGGRVKTMKAPGRNGRMARSVFENDPKGSEPPSHFEMPHASTPIAIAVAIVPWELFPASGREPIIFLVV